MADSTVHRLPPTAYCRPPNSNAAVGEHLADQLLVPLAIGGGGSFTTLPLSGHSLTNIDTIRRFVDRPMATEQVRNGIVRVTIG